MVAEIAKALGDLNESVVFIGDAVVSIYADDPAADEIRPTQDVDLTLKLLDYDQQELDAELAERGFHPDLQGHAICTYKYNDISVDIMASTDSMRGPTNRWYSIGFDSLHCNRAATQNYYRLTELLQDLLYSASCTCPRPQAYIRPSITGGWCKL